jgi:hypothetical protein
MNGPSEVNGPRKVGSDSVDLTNARLAGFEVGRISWNRASFDYPFSAKYTRLEGSKLADDTKRAIEDVVSRIIGKAIDTLNTTDHTEFVLTELVRNASQYAGVDQDTTRTNHVEIEWIADANENEPCLILAISNSTPCLFNPAKYSNTPFEDLPLDNNQGHLNLLAIPGMVKPGTHLTYRWETKTSEVITCAMSYFEENDTDRPEIHEVATPAIRITVSKRNSGGATIPYPTEQFLQDVAQGLPTARVTVTCVIGRAAEAP